MRYWLFKDNQVTGPFEPEDLSSQPSFSAESLVCPEGRKGTSMGDWQRAGVLPELSVSLIKASQLQPVGAPAGGGVFGTLPPEPTLRDLAALGSLQEKISVLESALGQMQEQLRFKDTELLALHREVEEKKRREQELASKVGGLEERLTSMSKLRENLDETMAAEKAVESSVKDVEHTVKDVESAIKGMESTVSRQRETIDKLNTELETLKEEMKKRPAASAAPAPAPLSETPASIPPSPFAAPKDNLATLGGIEPAPKPAPTPFGEPPALDLDAPTPVPAPAPGFPSAATLPPPAGLERAPQKLEPVPVPLSAVKPAEPIKPLFDPTAGASVPPAPMPAPAPKSEPPASLKPAPVPASGDLAGGAAPIVDQGAASAPQPAAGGKKKLVLAAAVLGAVGVAGYLGLQMGFIGGAKKKAPEPVTAPVEEPQTPLPPPEPQTPPPSAADMQLEEMKQQAIGLVRMWPSGAATAGAKLEALPPASAQASPWFAEKLAEGLFQVNYYAAGPAGQVVYEFQVRPAEKQVSALNTAAKELLEAKKPEAAKPPRKVRVRAKEKPAAESSGLLDNPLGSALGEEPAAEKPEEPAEDEAAPALKRPAKAAKAKPAAKPVKSAKEQKAADEAALEDLLGPAPAEHQPAEPVEPEAPKAGKKAAKEPSDSELLDELLQP